MPPPENSRAENDLELTLGEVLTDEDGHRQVFIGWRRNTAGLFPVFVMEQREEFAIADWAYTVHMYQASITDTLCRKFPELASRRRA